MLCCSRYRRYDVAEGSDQLAEGGGICARCLPIVNDEGGDLLCQAHACQSYVSRGWFRVAAMMGDDVLATIGFGASLPSMAAVVYGVDEGFRKVDGGERGQ